MTVVAWTSCYEDRYPTVTFTPERQKALVERVKRRGYNFSYQMFLTPYTTPVYDDGCKTLLTKSEWDNVLAVAYGDSKMPPRCTPMDVLTVKKHEALWEKEKFIQGIWSDNV